METAIVAQIFWWLLTLEVLSQQIKNISMEVEAIDNKLKQEKAACSSPKHSLIKLLLLQVARWLGLKNIEHHTIYYTPTNNALAGTQVAILYSTQVDEQKQQRNTSPLGTFLLQDGTVIRHIKEPIDAFGDRNANVSN